MMKEPWTLTFGMKTYRSRRLLLVANRNLLLFLVFVSLVSRSMAICSCLLFFVCFNDLQFLELPRSYFEGSAPVYSQNDLCV